MGQKVSPTGFRLGITEDWRSRWYAGKDYAKTLENDIAIRKFLDKQLARASVSRVDIERAGDKIKVTITTARPGVVIGKKGAEIDALRKKLEKVADGPGSIDVGEVKRPELDAELIAQSVAEQREGDCTSEDYLLMQLRLVSGLHIPAYARRGGRFTAAQRVFMRQCVGHGYAVWDGEVFRLTPAGMVVQNAILEELM